MPWCPKCRNEYREGIAVCAECGVELVDSLEECGKQAFIFGEKDKMERLQSFLAYNQIETAISYDEEDHTYQLSVGEMKLKQAVKMTHIFLQQEEKMSEEEQITEDGEQAYEDDNQEETVSSEREDLQGEQIEHHEEARGYHAYQNSATRAEDNRSSAYTLLAVGSIGFVVILLMFLGVIPVYQNAGMTKYLVCGVMGAMFILFIVFGVVSMRSSKVLFSKAKAEDSLMTEMEKWCQTNLSPSKVDEGLFEDEELPEEQKYFKRTDKMKSMISDKFLNLDEAFLDHFIDEYYQKLYEES